MERKAIIVNNGEVKEFTFDEVVEQFKPFMYSVCKTWYKTYEVEDVNQICLLGLYKSYKNYNSSKGYSFISFSKMVIENELKMYHRKEARMIKPCYLEDRIPGTDKIKYADIMEDEVNYEDKAISKVIINDVYKAMDSFSEKNKNILIDYYINNLNQRDLEKKYKISQSCISRIIQRSIKKLKKTVSYL